MSYLVLETYASYCVVLDTQGRFIKTANMGYAVGDKVDKIYPLESAKKSGNSRRLRPLVATISTLAACMVLVFSSMLYSNNRVYGTVHFSVNPEVSIGLNKKSSVIELKGVNPEGEALVKGFDFKGRDVLEVTRHLIAEAIRSDYLTSDGAVSLSIESRDEQWYQQLGISLRENIPVMLPEGGNIRLAIAKYNPYPEADPSSVEESSLPESSEPESNKPESSKPESSKLENSVTKEGSTPSEASIPKESDDGTTGSSADGSSTGSTTDDTPKAGELTLAEAKNIALNHAGVAVGNAVFTKAQSDYDKGIKIYELEFVSGLVEYEYEIRASDGGVLKADADNKDDAVSTPEMSKGITQQQAVAAALSHAGFSQSQIEDLDVDYEDDDNSYEVEFEVGDTDYKYRINAANGSVISVETN